MKMKAPNFRERGSGSLRKGASTLQPISPSEPKYKTCTTCPQWLFRSLKNTKCQANWGRSEREVPPSQSSLFLCLSGVPRPGPTAARSPTGAVGASSGSKASSWGELRDGGRPAGRVSLGVGEASGPGELRDEGRRSG